MIEFEKQPNLIDYVVPLYSFECDAELLELSDFSELIRYEPERFADWFEYVPEFLNYMKLFPPDFLLRLRQIVSGQESIGHTPGGDLKFTFPSLIKRVAQLLTALRLFKGHRLQAGPAFVLCKLETEPLDLYYCIPAWRTEMGVGATQSRRSSVYHLESREVKDFAAFEGIMRHAFDNLENKPNLHIATVYYNLSHEPEDPRQQLINLFISLEALLLDEDQELTYRLALRSANLLGKEPGERRALQDMIRKFYRARSKLVHGDILKGEQELLSEKNLDDLRDLVRRVLLSVAALVPQTEKIYEQLDAMALDEGLRSEIQQRVSNFLGPGCIALREGSN